jgi:hypothetical protein
MLVVEAAASAPALQLEDCRKAGSVCRRKLAGAAVLGYVVGDQVERGSSLCGGDVAEGAAADVALDAVKFLRTGVMFLAAVVRDHAESVASHRWA